MIRTLIVDDEPLARARLRRLLARHPHVEIVGEATTGIEARAEVLRALPDLVLLDVNMPEEDGVTALRAIRAFLPAEQQPQVIFTTAHAEHAIAAFELEGADYLLKPVEAEALARGLSRAQARLRASTAESTELAEATPAHLAGQRGAALVPVPYAQVIAVLVEDGLAWACTADGRVRLRDPLASVEPLLGDDFVRLSRAAVARISAITGLEPGASGTFRVRLRGLREPLHVSRRQGRDLRRRLGL